MHKGIRNYRPLPTAKGELRPQSSPTRTSVAGGGRSPTLSRSQSLSMTMMSTTTTSTSMKNTNNIPHNSDQMTDDKPLLAEVAECSPVRRLGYMQPEVQYFDDKVEKKKQMAAIAEEKRREQEHKKAWEEETKETDLSPSSLAKDYANHGVKHRASSFSYSRTTKRRKAAANSNANANGGMNRSLNGSMSMTRTTMNRTGSSTMLNSSNASGAGGGLAMMSGEEGGLDYDAEYNKLLNDEEYLLRVPPPPQGPPTFVIVATNTSSSSSVNSQDVPVTLATSFDRARAAASAFWRVPKYGK